MAATPLTLFPPRELASPSEVLYTVPTGKSARILKFTIAKSGTAEAVVSFWLKPASQTLSIANQIVFSYVPVTQSTNLSVIEGHILNEGAQIIGGNTGPGGAVVHCSGVEFTL